MAKELEVDDLNAISRLSIVQIINDLVAFVEIDQLDVVLVAHRVDVPDQVLLVLRRAVDVALLVDQPGDHRIRILRLDLLGPNPAGADEIGPPMIVRLLLVFLPHHQGRSADDEDVFARSGGGGSRLSGQQEAAKKEKREQSFHRGTGSSIYAGSGAVASGSVGPSGFVADQV